MLDNLYSMDFQPILVAPHKHKPHEPPHQPPTTIVIPIAAHAATHIASWVFFGFFTAAFIGTFVLALRKHRSQRIFHCVSALALSISMTAYFFMSVGLGSTHDHHHGPDAPITVPEKPTRDIYVRQVFWIQDAAHILTLPLYLIQLCVLAGMAPLHGVMVAVAAAMSGVFALGADAFSPHRRFVPRLPFVGLCVISFLWMLAAWSLIFLPGTTAARKRKSKTRGLFYLGTIHLFVGWAAYAVIFFLGTGLNILGVDAEVIVCGIIDVATQIGFTYFILFTHVHDDEDPMWEFPEWFIIERGDGRGSYAAVASGDNAEGNTGTA